MMMYKIGYVVGIFGILIPIVVLLILEKMKLVDLNKKNDRLYQFLAYVFIAIVAGTIALILYIKI